MIVKSFNELYVAPSGFRRKPTFIAQIFKLSYFSNQFILCRHHRMNPALEIASQYGGLWTPPPDTAFPIDIEATERYLRRLQASNYLLKRPPVHFGLLANLK